MAVVLGLGAWICASVVLALLMGRGLDAGEHGDRRRRRAALRRESFDRAA